MARLKVLTLIVEAHIPLDRPRVRAWWRSAGSLGRLVGAALATVLLFAGWTPSSHALTEGPKYAGASGTNAFTNPSNAVGSGDTTCASGYGVPNIVGFWKNFGFTLPTNATINGIEVEVKVSWTQDAPANQQINIGKNESTLGTAKSLTVSSQSCGSGQTVSSFGGSSDKWGLSWTAADLNSSDFTVRINRGTNESELQINWIRVTVHYTNPSAVRLSSFTAASHEGGVKLDWKTGYEVNNLGFHVYREERGERVRLTPELVAGTALLAGVGTALTSGHRYSWLDPFLSPQSSSLSPQHSPLSPVRYWLEDIDLNGTRTWHGPISPVASQQALSNKLKPELLSEFSQRLNQKYDDFWRGQDLKEKLRRSSPIRQMGSVKVIERTAKALGQEGIKAVVQSERRSGQEIAAQWMLAGGPAVKLMVKEEGWYRVTKDELSAAGLSPTANARNLQLYRDGQEQPIRVLSEKSHRREAEKAESLVAVEFYGQGLDTVSSDVGVYWLIEGSNPGKRIGVGGRLSSRISVLSAPKSFPYTLEKKERVIFFAALKNGEEESFFGPLITSEPVDQVLTVTNHDPSSPSDPVLEVAVQGLSNVAHRVKVLFNEVEVGEVVFEGQTHALVRFSLPSSYLLDGDNVVTLFSQGGETDVSLIDRIRLTYWHTYMADQNSLRFSAQGGEQVTVGGFNESSIRVIDIGDPQAVQEVAGVVEPRGSSYAVSFQVPGRRNRTLLAFTESRVKQPSSLISNQPSAWRQQGAGADLVIISHRSFLKQVEPLKALREGQGLAAVLIDVEDLYDEFSFGARSPRAIKDFLTLTRVQWHRPPRFVLFVGDASFDPKNYLGFGDFDLVPTKLVETVFLKTASDDWYVDFDNDGLPEMAVGRLPVRTQEEATTVVSKIIGYEQGTGSSTALLVADMNDGFDFEGASDALETLLPAFMGVQKIYRGSFASDAEAREALIGGMNQGSLLVNYVGHGSVEILRGLLSSNDARSLTNSRHPFFISMTCLNGFFHDVYTESLAEALLKAEGGAMAVWASSGLTAPGEQAVMDRELIDLLFNGGSLTLGEAVVRAKASITDADIRKTWVLLGDPATKLH